MAIRALALLFFLLTAGALRADVPLPPRVLNPESPAEAWNVIRISVANMGRLLAENRPGELPAQASLCSPALRLLATAGPSPEAKEKLQAITRAAFADLEAVAMAATRDDSVTARAALKSLEKQIATLAGQFDEKTTRAQIYQCPMHPEVVSPDPATPCAKCGMDLLLRRIPYSFIYTPPGKPTITIAATADAPLAAGRKAEVKVMLKKGDGSPVQAADLLVMHTERIHLLIVDPTLADYHHEHPVATNTPGEYVFSFTPRLNSSYRIFADLVPVANGVQEYPFVDLAGVEKGGKVKPGADQFESEAGGLRFQLSFHPPGPPRAGESRLAIIKVINAAGDPVQQLAPVMNAFAHLVGFYDDYRTIVHIHPEGGEITNAALRGGPRMTFRFFPPRAGHLRLYCQVLVEGRMIFAPFDVNVAP